MTTYVVSIEGQSIPVPPEIGAEDESVKRALTPFYPEVANALITRAEENDQVTITVVKRAGTKGHMDQALKARAGGRNPAIELYLELAEKGVEWQNDPLKLLEMDEHIEQAMEQGQEQEHAVEKAARRLARSAGRSSPFVPVGF